MKKFIIVDVNAKAWNESKYLGKMLGFDVIRSKEYFTNYDSNAEYILSRLAFNLFGGQISSLYKSILDVTTDLVRKNKPIYVFNTDTSLNNVIGFKYSLIRTQKLGIYDLKGLTIDDIISKIKAINQRDCPLYMNVYYKDQMTINDNPKYNLVYGGQYRPKRQKSIEKYLLNNKHALVTGRCAIHIGGVECTGKTTSNNNDFYTELLNNSISTLCIYDEPDKNKWKSWRPYEAIRSAAVPFIDEDADINHTHIPIDYLYVNSREQLNNKINELRQDLSFRNKLINQCID